MTITSSVESLCNQALDRIAWPEAIGDIYEGSKAARVALRVYGQERDELLSSVDWQFARREVGLTVIKTAPVGGYGATSWSSDFPLLPWIYEYAYPDQCLQIRSVRAAPIIMPDFDPVPNIFTVANDPSLAVPGKVVLTNIAGAVASFTAAVTDPAQWADTQFIEALIERLALRFQEALNPQPDAVKDRAAETQVGTAMAQDNRG